MRENISGGGTTAVFLYLVCTEKPVPYRTDADTVVGKRMTICTDLFRPFILYKQNLFTIFRHHRAEVILLSLQAHMTMRTIRSLFFRLKHQWISFHNRLKRFHYYPQRHTTVTPLVRQSTLFIHIIKKPHIDTSINVRSSLSDHFTEKGLTLGFYGNTKGC